ncbi:MAG: Asp23/Gls24 family envelope stress response protein [Gaiellaceae bacterium]
MEGRASISSDIIASYAADAARDVDGIDGLVESRIPPHRGVRVSDAEGRITVELHVRIEWGASIPDVGRSVQGCVRDYLTRMADVDLAGVDVVVDEIGAP